VDPKTRYEGEPDLTTTIRFAEGEELSGEAWADDAPQPRHANIYTLVVVAFLHAGGHIFTLVSGYVPQYIRTEPVCCTLT